ncbi:MAG: hypothetical protein ACI38A_01870 [Candidatus Ornithomonoglobus sp.]
MDIKIDHYGKTIIFSGFPNKCPMCRLQMHPNIVYNHIRHPNKVDHQYRVISICQCAACDEFYSVSFCAEPIKGALPRVTKVSYLPYPAPDVVFPAHIEKISTSFINIYKQAVSAQELNLDELVGMGLRKAFEFLIKDYLIYKEPEKADAIKAKFLGNCISEDIDNVNIKEMAKRAVWLGNDHTHYTPQFTEKDITDLISIINLTVYWISAELETEEWRKLQRR